MATERRVGRGFYGLVFVAMLLTLAVHGGGHWVVAEALGHNVYDALIKAGHGLDCSGEFFSDSHSLMVLAGGPAATVIQAIAAFALVMGRGGASAYAFLFSTAFMQFTVTTPISLGDEALIGLLLGWGRWPLPLVVFAGLAVLTLIAARKLRLGWKINLGAGAAAALAGAAVYGLKTAFMF